jgi:hypothetical protein
MQEQKRGRSIDPTLPQHDTRRMWVVSTKPRPLYRRIVLEAGWASGLSGRKKNLACMGLDPRHSSPQQVAFRCGTSIKCVVIKLQLLLFGGGIVYCVQRLRYGVEAGEGMI